MSDLIGCKRVARRAVLLQAQLTFGKCDLVLKLCDGTGQQLQGRAIVATQRLAQFCLADDLAQVLRHDKARVISSRTIDEVPDFASHYDAHL